MHTNDELSFYSRHSPMTNPGRYRGLFAELPGDASALASVVQSLTSTML
ncbi:MAG: hypothetical protein JO227_01935 [Acetobacteraceae bacterium]|nr:hypothetical protein [Acetobacteraceae bacterium]